MPPGFRLTLAPLLLAMLPLLALLEPAAAAPDQAAARLLASAESGWPQFRGPRRDGVSDETGLLPAWPEGGPRLLWSVKGLGTGYSSPIVVGSQLFMSGDVDDELRVVALDREGQRLWSAPNGKAWTGDFPGARASLTYSERFIYHQNAHGRLACWNAADGQERWAVNLREQFGAKEITWGLSECLLVDARAIYVCVGGPKALVAALDKRTGELLWKTPPLIDPEGDGSPDTPGYASPILIEFAGRRLLIGCSSKHLYCVDVDAHALQWTHRLPTAYAVLAMSPVLVGDGIFMTAPLGKQFGWVRLVAPSAPGERVGVLPGWTSPFDNCQGGVVKVGDKLIGSFYSPRKGWAALDPHSGQVLYSAPDLAKGSVIFADGRLYALSEDGWMTLLEAGEQGFTAHGKFRAFEPARRDAWAHPVVCEGRLYLRYHDELRCYDLRVPTASR